MTASVRRGERIREALVPSANGYPGSQIARDALADLDALVAAGAAAEQRAEEWKSRAEITGQWRTFRDECDEAVARADRLEQALAWGEAFLARHDAFLQRQTPQLAHAMSDAADGFRAALASPAPDRDEAE